jgi:hypothetical protein
VVRTARTLEFEHVKRAAWVGCQNVDWAAWLSAS